MGKYYSSSEETWNEETIAQEKIADGISKLYQINSALDRGFDELKSDKYGLMSNNSYDNFSYQIEQCGEKNHALSQYSKEIHGILKDKENSFCKGISKVIEEMSLLEITDYSTKNTLGITERKNVSTTYYNGSMAYQAGMPISYQVKDVLKGKINILDIQMKTDILGIEEQLEVYLKEENGNLTDAKLIELKKKYYQQYLQTSFEHEVYTDGWLKGLSTTLDYVPIVGGVKNAVEGLCGYTMSGEKLTTQERISYTALGILTTAVDVFTLGTASGLIQGGKFVGKGLAKNGIKQLGKYAIMDSVSSVTMGWGSQFASEKLRDFGLSAEGIFAVHALVGVTILVRSKYKANKLSSTSFVDGMSFDDAKRYNQFWDDIAKGLDTDTRVKLDQWEFRPSADLYNKYKNVYDNPKFFNQSTGKVIYPGMNGDVNIDGFVDGKYDIEILQSGKIIDRYGGNSGKFFSPDGTDYEARALPPFMEGEPYTRYEIVVPFEVKSGIIAPWFNQPGGGIQYLADYSVEELLDLGWIKELK